MSFSFFQSEKNKLQNPCILKPFKNEEKDWVEWLQKSSGIESIEACIVGDKDNLAIYFIPCEGEVVLMEKQDGKWQQISSLTQLCVIPVSGNTQPEKALRGLLLSYMEEKAHYMYATIPFNLIPLICQRMANGKSVEDAIEDIKGNPQLKSKLRSLVDLVATEDETLNQIKDDALVLITSSENKWRASAQTERQKIEDRIELLHSILVGLESAPPKLKEIISYLDDPANSEVVAKQIRIFSILTGGK